MKNTHLLIVLFFLFSCKKEKQNPQFPESLPSVKQEAKVTFSKTLAIALDKEPTLRAFIKSEALKRFDNDNDVLVQMVLDETIGTETVSEILFKYAPSKAALQEALDALPTLTILIPEVPNFTPATWNTSSEIPMVAVAPEGKHFNSIDLYNAKLEVTKAPYGLVPGFPIVVVKENERVTITGNSSSSSSKKASKIMQVNHQNSAGKTRSKYNFQFINVAFDGTSNVSNNLSTPVSGSEKLARSNVDNRISRNVTIPYADIIDYNTYSLDVRVVDAFKKNVDWHRDYIYYGIEPGVEKGKFNNRYVEHIVSLKITRPVSSLTDSPEDPVEAAEFQKHRPPSPAPQYWTDGIFEIRVNILINAKGGAGTNLEKIFSLPGNKLYKTDYQQEDMSNRWYRVNSTPIECFVNEPIAPWDFENYGSQWKFIVSEFDNATTQTVSYTNTTKYASNFQFDVGFGDKVKVGAKFGGSIETSEATTHQMVTTLSSDQLGEGILEFSSPVILRREDNVPYVPSGRPSLHPNAPYNRYVTNDVTGGSFVLTVEPKYR